MTKFKLESHQKPIRSKQDCGYSPLVSSILGQKDCPVISDFTDCLTYID